MCTNKPSLHYLYFKPSNSYKNFGNRDRDMKFLDLFKPELETIIVHVFLATNRKLKLNQLNQIYFIKSRERFNATIVISIMSKTQLLYGICINFKMLKLRSFIKTGLQDLQRLTQLRHTTPLSITLHNIFINREIHYVIRMRHLGILLLNIILLRHYLELSLVT